MIDPSETRSPPARTATPVAIALVAVVALVTALQGYLAQHGAGPRTSQFTALLMGVGTWITWAVGAPAIIALGRRFDFRRGHRLTSALAHLIAFALLHAIATGVAVGSGYLLLAPPGEPFPTASGLWRVTLTSVRLQLGLFAYASILGLDRWFAAGRRLEEKQLQATRLEAQAVRSRLDALALRLHPHFLFNTLHTIGALIDENPAMARRMVVQFGELLRDMLAEPGATEIPLREEVALLRRYLDIEQVRFADRLRVDVSIPDTLLDAAVPRLILQPLAENALRHGLAPLARGGVVRITAARFPDRLELVVWNDGVPIKAGSVDRIGLATTRERLVTQYGGRATLVLRNGASGGVESIVSIPMEGG